MTATEGMNTTPSDLFSLGSVTIDGLRTEYGVGRSTAYDWMNRGLLPYTCIHGRRLIPRRAVQELLASGLTHESK